MSKIRFGVGIPTSRDGLMYPPGFCSKESLVKITLLAEELGFDSVWGNDHITTQSYLKGIVPKPNYFEVMTSLAYLAAKTERVRLGTGVVPFPLRSCINLAKEAATLDNLSDGRFILGLGIGAYREEFESIGGRGNRGEILDEGLRALSILFTKDDASFEGKYFKFSHIDLNPKPLQKPFPIYVGGNAHEHLKRIAKYGRGWLPAIMPADKLHDSLEELATLLRQNGRTISEVDVAMEAAMSVSSTYENAKHAFMKSPMYEHIRSLSRSTLKEFDLGSEDSIVKSNFVGTPDVISETIDSYIKSGVTTLWFDFIGNTISEVISMMQFFAGEVMPSF
ncbi:MAG: TIGR03619 family F420-dependent LLM class oxidoreductase [Nitrososphaerota archaeon]|nr:TIGR03619 family F420-dependent LLM class oxidoreductase [Nitrososphaerota archaeon]